MQALGNDRYAVFGEDVAPASASSSASTPAIACSDPSWRPTRAHAPVACGRSHDRLQGIVAFGDEPMMRRILEPDGHLAFWSEHPHGGHSPAMEAPDDLVGDIRACVARLLTV